MILIADSGSTKTDWAIISSGKPVWKGETKGLNPYYLTEKELGAEIKKSFLPILNGISPDQVYFYGAGCMLDKAETVKRVLKECIKAERVEVYSDLMAAAHSLCGSRPGIACILGTGSNACFFDGTRITKHIPPLGFVLGDEGSGAVLGKLLIGNLLKGFLGKELNNKFFLQYGYSESDIIDKVYRKPFPNRFLASFAPFIKENIHVPEIHELALNSFIAFFTRNVLPLGEEGEEANAVGSIAYHFKDILQEAAAMCNIRMGKIIQSPMEGLIIHHS